LCTQKYALTPDAKALKDVHFSKTIALGTPRGLPSLLRWRFERQRMLKREGQRVLSAPLTSRVTAGAASRQCKPEKFVISFRLERAAKWAF
jgi:hypothetical protein